MLVPGSAAAWRDVTATADASDVAAVSLGASAPTPATPIGGQRVVVEPAAFTRLSDAGKGVVIRHEVSHLAAAAWTPPGMQSWLVEGTADVVGFAGSGVPVTRAAQELANDLRVHGLPHQLPTDAEYAGGTPSVAYEEGWLACRLIEQRAGPAGLRSFYEQVARAAHASSASRTPGTAGSTAGSAAGSTAAGTAVDAALRRVTGWDLGSFVHRWQQSMRAQLDPSATAVS